MSSQRRPISPFDDVLWGGLKMLRDFIGSVKLRNKRDINGVAQQLVELIVNEHYLPLLMVDTALEVNIIESWKDHERDLAGWLEGFMKYYGFNSDCLLGLSESSRAKTALALLMVLAKDLIESHGNEIRGNDRFRWLFDESAVSWSEAGLSLGDLVGDIYPVAMSLVSTGATSQGTDPVSIAAQVNAKVGDFLMKTKKAGKKGGTSYKVYRLLHAPLTVAGLMAEYPSDLLGIAGQKYRFFVTGTGHMFNNFMKIALSYPLNVNHYESILRSLTALAHVNEYILTEHVLDKSLDESARLSVLSAGVRRLIQEYEHCSNLPQEIRDYYYYSFTDAFQDIMAALWTTFALLNELMSLESKGLLRSSTVDRLRAHVTVSDINSTRRSLIMGLWLSKNA